MKTILAKNEARFYSLSTLLTELNSSLLLTLFSLFMTELYEHLLIEISEGLAKCRPVYLVRVKRISVLNYLADG